MLGESVFTSAYKGGLGLFCDMHLFLLFYSILDLLSLFPLLFNSHRPPGLPIHPGLPSHLLSKEASFCHLSRLFLSNPDCFLQYLSGKYVCAFNYFPAFSSLLTAWRGRTSHNRPEHIPLRYKFLSKRRETLAVYNGST